MAQYMSSGPYQPDPYLRLVPDQRAGGDQEDETFREPPTAPQPILSRVPLPPLPPLPPLGSQPSRPPLGPRAPQGPVPSRGPAPSRGPVPPQGAGPAIDPLPPVQSVPLARPVPSRGPVSPVSALRSVPPLPPRAAERPVAEVSHGDAPDGPWGTGLGRRAPRDSAPYGDVPWDADPQGDVPQWGDAPECDQAPGASQGEYGLWDPAREADEEDLARLARVRKTGRRCRVLQVGSLIAAIGMAAVLAFTVMRNHVDQHTLMVAPVIIITSVANYIRAGKIVAVARAAEQRILAS
jgi:hypothetical protein